MSFCKTLITWYEENGRTLPWRGTTDPYKIWLSEIILQQTRIEQGWQYYERFVEKFPTIKDLADASEQDVLKIWQGLGYYSRARNLHATARQIAYDLGGAFPCKYEDILKMKGVGRYTAAAIASFAFRLPYPVIDGNVYRFVSRYYGICTPIGTTAAYNEFEGVLKKVMDTTRPDVFNQAIMDFGSTYCKPTGYDCENCVFSRECVAFRDGKTDLLPVKEKAGKVTERFFYYYIIIWNEGEKRTIVRQRDGKDIWKGLYEFPLVEIDHGLSEEELGQQTKEFLSRFSDEAPLKVERSEEYVHKLTHRTIRATFVSAILKNARPPEGEGMRAIGWEEMKNLPISRLIDKYLSKL